MTDSALSQRCAQIPTEVFRAVFDRFNSACTDGGLFRDYRLFSGRWYGGQSSPQSRRAVLRPERRYPQRVNQLHATPLHDILNRTFSDVVI